jgi:hypothetical protein
VNPLECSIVCHTSWARNVFQPVIDRLDKETAKAITVSSDEYLVMSVINAGMEAASRVMELTCPLAIKGIPILFITTYYSDFILVPSNAQEEVTEALQEHGFAIADSSTEFAATKGPVDQDPPQRTAPLESTVAELQLQTFDLLRKGGVMPYIEDGLRLVLCSGRDTNSLTSEFAHHSSRRPGSGQTQPTWIDNVDTKLYTAMVSALVSQPRFFSVTLARAREDPPSLLLDKSLLGIFGDSLMGDTEGELVPIFLDLSNLPIDASGVVCGVAARIVTDVGDGSELSYLSTAHTGAVILTNDQAVQVLSILKPELETTS